MKKTLFILIILALVTTAIFVSVDTEKEVRVSGTSNFGDISLTGNLTTGGIFATTTSSSTAGTLSENDIFGYSTIVVTGASSTANNVLRLPATSTLMNLIPTPGDSYKFTIVNATTTGASTLTVTTNTGISLRLASSTATIPVGGNAQITLIRNRNTDVIANVETY